MWPDNGVESPKLDCKRGMKPKYEGAIASGMGLSLPLDLASGIQLAWTRNAAGAGFLKEMEHKFNTQRWLGRAGQS